MGIVEAIAAAARTLIGEPTSVPAPLAAQYPELAEARWRRGGLPVRVGGWCLGQQSVSAITLWRTIWLAPGVDLTDELALHERRHVTQFEASAAFPLLYLWESVRRGYVRNRFEVDARAYAASRVRRGGRP
ncbi:MAG TPA: hypothetical protein VN651_06135 [Gemmatimonadaceae bacterium]|nr:hypothetical protein [Gemmatimonadaceae bacterium]